MRAPSEVQEPLWTSQIYENRRKSVGSSRDQDADVEYLLAHDEARLDNSNRMRTPDISWETIHKRSLYERLLTLFRPQQVQQGESWKQGEVDSENTFRDGKESEVPSRKNRNWGKLTLKVVAALLTFW